MKWLSKLFKIGINNRGVTEDGQQPQFLGEENMSLHAPVRSLDDRPRTKREKDELDRTISLSLNEDLRRPNGYKRRTDNDEDLARSLRDRPNKSSHPPYALRDPPYAPQDYDHRRHRVCSGYYHEIAYGNYLEQIEMATEYKLIPDIKPGESGWTVKAIVSEKCSPNKARNSPLKYRHI
ncbi:unnamed protein product [Fraxinus pennsylvanica]|uniref:Uncharacterized protein n=1 Tax=Fraxinus pennsylvanica TaxID=56036 RepID=A0AAD2A234_9LAMI|nr:unnamed protein product [Fraxinus pennsylvanica]